MSAQENPEQAKSEQPRQNDEQLKLIEKKQKFSILNMAKNYKQSKRMMKYAGATAAVGVGVAVIVPFLGVAMLFGLALGGIAFMATILLAFNRIRSFKGARDVMDMAMNAASKAQDKAATAQAAEATVDATVEAEAPPRQYTMWEMKGAVCCFGVEPTIQEIIKVNNSAATAPGLERIPNGANVIILLDEGRDAVKVKVCDGEHVGHVGWVARTSLMGLEKKAV